MSTKLLEIKKLQELLRYQLQVRDAYLAKLENRGSRHVSPDQNPSEQMKLENIPLAGTRMVFSQTPRKEPLRRAEAVTQVAQKVYLQEKRFYGESLQRTQLPSGTKDESLAKPRPLVQSHQVIPSRNTINFPKQHKPEKNPIFDIRRPSTIPKTTATKPVRPPKPMEPTRPAPFDRKQYRGPNSSPPRRDPSRAEPPSKPKLAQQAVQPKVPLHRRHQPSMRRFRRLTLPSFSQAPLSVVRLQDTDLPTQVCALTGKPKDRLCLQCCLFECHSCLSLEQHHDPATGHFVVPVGKGRHERAVHARWKRVVTLTNRQVRHIFGVASKPVPGKEEPEACQKFRKWIELLSNERRFGQYIAKDFGFIVREIIEGKEVIENDPISRRNGLDPALKKSLQNYIKEQKDESGALQNPDMIAALADLKIFTDSLRDIANSQILSQTMIDKTKELVEFFGPTQNQLHAQSEEVECKIEEEDDSSEVEILEPPQLGKRNQPYHLQQQLPWINLPHEHELFRFGKRRKPATSTTKMIGCEQRPTPDVPAPISSVNYIVNVMNIESK